MNLQIVFIVVQTIVVCYITRIIYNRIGKTILEISTEQSLHDFTERVRTSQINLGRQKVKTSYLIYTFQF